MLMNTQSLKAALHELKTILQELGTWEQNWLNKSAVEQSDQLTIYLETKQGLINRAEQLFQGGQLFSQVQDETLRQLPSHEAVKIYELRQDIGNLFQSIWNLHVENQKRMQAQTESTKQDLQSIQQAMAYVAAYRATMQPQPRVDISQ